MKAIKPKGNDRRRKSMESKKTQSKRKSLLIARTIRLTTSKKRSIIKGGSVSDKRRSYVAIFIKKRTYDRDLAEVYNYFYQQDDRELDMANYTLQKLMSSRTQLEKKPRN